MSDVARGLAAVFTALVLALPLSAPQAAGAERLEVNMPAPPFELEGMDGSRISLESLKGKVVLLNFWATWCAPCVNEMPYMEEAHSAGKDRGLVVIGVNVYQKADRVERFLEKTGISFTIGLDPKGKMARDYGVSAIPATFLLGRDGKILNFVMGVVSREQLDQWLAEAL